MDKEVFEMKKDDLLKIIKEGIRFESSIPIYLNHLSTIVTQTELGENYVSQIRALMEYLTHETSAHKKILEDTLSKIEKETGDVY